MIAGPRVRIEDRKSFQKLKTTLHRRVVDAIDPSRSAALDEEELRNQLRALVTHICSAEPVNLAGETREAMVREILDEIYGLGPLEPVLADPTVSEVLVNGPDSVRIDATAFWKGRRSGLPTKPICCGSFTVLSKRRAGGSMNAHRWSMPGSPMVRG